MCLFYRQKENSQSHRNHMMNEYANCEVTKHICVTAVTVSCGFARTYSHVDTNGGIVDCEGYSVLNILLNLCKAVKKD